MLFIDRRKGRRGTSRRRGPYTNKSTSRNKTSSNNRRLRKTDLFASDAKGGNCRGPHREAHGIRFGGLRIGPLYMLPTRLSRISVYSKKQTPRTCFDLLQKWCSYSRSSNRGRPYSPYTANCTARWDGAFRCAILAVLSKLSAVTPACFDLVRCLPRLSRKVPHSTRGVMVHEKPGARETF